MVDVAENNGHRIDEAETCRGARRARFPIVASTGAGVPELRAKIIATVQSTPEMKPELFCQLPGLFRIEATGLASLLAETFQERRFRPPRRRCCCSAMKKRWPRARNIIRKKFRTPWPLPASGSKRTA